MAQKEVSPQLSGLLGFNAGYVDTAGFLALSGLFTAHVTGNFVTLGAALVMGSSGALPKLAALPVFCAVAMLTRWISNRIVAHGNAPLRWLIGAKIVLLAFAASLMMAFGPFPDANAWPAFAAGMLMVAAMGVQNAMQRMHLPSAPPSTLMTGNTTQAMIDVADMLQDVQGDARNAAKARLRKMVPAIAWFALGCALAAIASMHIGMWSFALPPIVALISTLFVDGRDATAATS